MNTELVENYKVMYAESAAAEAREILKKPAQYLFCVHQARLLRFFPVGKGKVGGKFFNLDIKKIEHYWELRIWDKILENVSVRIMFAVFSKPKEIWILCVYPKKSRATPLAIRMRCKYRIKRLLQEGYEL